MDEDAVLLSYVDGQLSHGLEEGHRLDVPHGASDLHQGNVHVCGLGHGRDHVLDLVRHVRDDLYRPTEIVSVPLLLDDGQVGLTRGDVVGPGELHIEEPLVIPQVQVHLTPILHHEDLAVLEWVHGPRIDVEVRIDLDRGDLQAPGLEVEADARSGYPLSQTGQNSPRHDDILHGDNGVRTWL